MAVRGFVVCLALAIGLLSLRFVGFLSSDDNLYLTGALGWLGHFPYVGDSHWTLRHTVTIPIALSVAAFGVGELAIILPTTAYFFAFLAVNYLFATRVFGILPAFIATVLLVTCPQLVVLESYANADVAELFYVAIAMWLLVYAISTPNVWWPWVGSGTFAALGVLTRETAIAFVFFVALLFIFRPLARRQNYLLFAAGLAPIALAEWLYLTLLTGNPLYRLSIDVHHDAVQRGAEAAKTAARGGLFDSAGNISLSVYFDPLLNLFVTQKYALLFWLAAAAFIWLWRQRRARSNEITAALLLVGLAFVYYAFVGFNPKLYLIQRYFVVPAWACAMVVGLWLATLWADGRRRTAGCVMLVALTANVLSLSLENTHPRYAERALVSFVQAHSSEIIYTDPETANRAGIFFRFANLAHQNLIVEKPGSEGLVFRNPDALRTCSESLKCPFDVNLYNPAANWQEIARIDPPARPLNSVIAFLRLDSVMPDDIARKLSRPTSPLTVYRIRNIDQ